jgi:hypothetical protein
MTRLRTTRTQKVYAVIAAILVVIILWAMHASTTKADPSIPVRTAGQDTLLTVMIKDQEAACPVGADAASCDAREHTLTMLYDTVITLCDTIQPTPFTCARLPAIEDYYSKHLRLRPPRDNIPD